VGGHRRSASVAAAPRVSFAATSDSRDSRSCKARLQRDCRAGLGTQRGSPRTMRKAQLFHATSAGARTRCVARLPRSQWNTVRLASAGRGPKGSMRAPWWTSAVGGRRRSARREIAPGSCSLAPAATKGCVCATHARRAGALVMRFSSADHNGGSRRDESPGALSGCAKHRRAPHRVGPPPRSSTRSITAVARNHRGDRVADHGVNASSCAMASTGRRPANR
jgi:hypothetical protein